MEILEKKYNAREISEALGMRLDLVYSRATNCGYSAANGLTIPQIKQMMSIPERHRKTLEVNPRNVEELRELFKLFGALKGKQIDLQLGEN